MRRDLRWRLLTEAICDIEDAVDSLQHLNRSLKRYGIKPANLRRIRRELRDHANAIAAARDAQNERSPSRRTSFLRESTDSSASC